MLMNLDIPPGLYANTSEYETGHLGRWRRSNLVRWSEGVLCPVGGWRQANPDDAYDGVCRSLYAWRSLSNARWLAVGTHTHLYAWHDVFGLTDITPEYFVEGREHAIDGAGYGADNYGEGEYGTPREGSGSVLEASQWSFDSWGENLVGVALQDERIVEWSPFSDPESAELAEPVADAPTCRSLFVTSERCLVALGADGDPSKVQWSTFEDNTVWAPSALNAAGDFRLQTTGRLLRGVPYSGTNLLFTNTDVHSMRFIGAPLIYSFERLGEACGAISPQSMVVTESLVAWMGERQFFLYDGIVRPLPCPVEELVFPKLDTAQASKVVAAINPQFSEIWWFYPVGLGKQSYVAWNYEENLWHAGTLSRDAICPPGVFETPVMASGGALYFHETGWTADGTPIGSDRWIESGAFSLPAPEEMGHGERVMTVRGMVPDERTAGQTQTRLRTRFYPGGPETSHGPYSNLVPPERPGSRPRNASVQRVDMLFQARQVTVRFEGVRDADWRIGLPRFDVIPGGRR